MTLTAWQYVMHKTKHNATINGFVPAKRHTIIWTNDGKFTDAYMRNSAWMS